MARLLYVFKNGTVVDFKSITYYGHVYNFLKSLYHCLIPFSYDLPHPVVLLPENTQADIKGLRKGIVGMCVGEVRSITVPAYLGYGDQEHITKKGQ